MNWFLIALIPPAVWSITNHLDKYLLSKYFKGGGVGALMVFSSLVGVFLLPIIYLLHPEALSVKPINAVLMALNGFLYVLAVLPYFYALNKDEASIAVPLFQLIPVFSYVLAYFVLGETLRPEQLIGGALIVTGAIGISLELSEGSKIKFKKDVFWLMMLSSLIFASNFLLFKYFALQEDFWTTSFWEYIGFAIFALLLITCVKSYRKEFIAVMKSNKATVLGLNGVNEFLNIFAKLSFNWASLLTPITVTWIVNGFQPFFVFIYGVILTIFLPQISKENITRNRLTQKIAAILIMFLGTYFLNR
jgi:drug/metabolite transporter (DMT)-like permease